MNQQDTQPMEPIERVKLARHERRPYTLDFVERIFTDFSEIHGDRKFGNDPAIVTGLANFHGKPVVIVGHQKGRDIKERQMRNFGMPKPDGYRKAIRAMKIAEKFNRPIFTLIDTSGAYPGIDAEERGQAEAIAFNLREMARITVPIIVTIIGEGGSGGALAIGVGDIVGIMENAVYSVITPEGCAAILWKDAKLAPQAAASMKLTAKDLLEIGIVDSIVPEPYGGAQNDWDATSVLLDKHLQEALKEAGDLSVPERLEKRYQKFRAMGAADG
jgi:acetyl-CoA carboxylase carboxyl transferase subunit alpha